MFITPSGTPLRGGNFRRRVRAPALVAAGVPGMHFHDLRHTGNTLTAAAGASLCELTDRMGPQQCRGRADLPSRQ
jgi:integrase